MDNTSFDYINHLVEKGVYRINETRGVLETDSGLPVLWNGHSINVCESANNLSADELNAAKKTLADFQDFVVKVYKRVGECSGSGITEDERPLGKERVKAQLDRWVDESEADLKDKYDRAQAVVKGIESEFAGYPASLRARLQAAAIAPSRRRTAAKELFEATGEYKCQIKANQAISELFWQRDVQQFNNENEVWSAIKSVAADYHREQQNRLLGEVIQLSELLVRQANESDAVLVFPGRSLIACAAYIEKKYPDIRVIKVPLSSAGRYERLSRIGLEPDWYIPLARALDPNEVELVKQAVCNGERVPEHIENLLIKPSFESGASFKYSVREVTSNCNQYLDGFLKKFKDHPLVLVDYVVTGVGLKNFADMVSDYRGKTDGVSTLAVYGNSVDTDKNQLDKFKSIIRNCQFTMGVGCFTEDGLLNDSLLAALLTGSVFDGFSPYGKHTVENIVRGVEVTGSEPADFAGFDEIGREASSLSMSSESDGQPTWKMV